MQVDGYDIDILVQGYPGKTVCHGGLGWSTIVLLRGHGRIALIDVGSFNIRGPLIERLAARGLEPRQVTDVLLTHSHWDHSVNWPLFKDARIVIGAKELAWSLEQPWGSTPVPELYVKELQRWPTVVTAEDNATVLPGITAHIAPGHTPGCLAFLLRGKDSDVIFTGDAAKNRAELVSGTTDMTYDAAVSRATIDMIWKVWRMRPGSIVVPGHDLPMVLDGDRPQYLGKREAAITSWYGDDLETTTLFELTLASADAPTQRVRITA
jgi:glyoxylase-like metal-dependent hydrolase (beta-lactamase superfamily II)